MGENKVIIMTPAELKEFANNIIREATCNKGSVTSEPTPAKRFVYGLRGIRDLFNVSHPTAQRYKNTFLAPAIMQRGRKIVVDADMAIQLYKSSVKDYAT